jgi:hypothetical protein
MLPAIDALFKLAARGQSMAVSVLDVMEKAFLL